MKILSISPYLPSESTGHAGAQLIYRNLKLLAKNHQVKLLCFINRSELEKAKALEQNNIEVRAIVFDRNSSGRLFSRVVRSLMPLFVALIRREPFSVSKYDKRDMRALVRKTAAEFDPDVVQIEFNVMHHYAVFFPRTPKILTQHDITTKIKKRDYRNSRSLVPRVCHWLAYRQWRRCESRLMRKFDAVITVTSEDKDYIRGWKHLPPLSVIPPQIFVKPLSEARKIPYTLCFVGSFNRKPNNQALQIIVKEIFPRVKARIPEVRLRVAGMYLTHKTTNEIRKLGGGEYFGFVEDIDEFIASSSLFVAPIFLGAGLKMKITHALACGTPVLTTSVGAEGIPLEEQDGLWVSDDVDAMAEKCIALLANLDYLAELGRRGQRRVKDIFSPERIEAQFRELYDSVIEKMPKNSLAS